MTEYVEGVLRKFIRRSEGQYLDHSHAYGPQAPDLIEYYLTDLLGRPWQFRAGAAKDLWVDLAGTMKDFERVHRGKQKQVSVDFKRGDVLVFDGGTGFGTVGIYTGPGSRVGSVQMFTQNPGPAHAVDIMADGHVHKLLGAWRLTYAAECKIVADKFAAQLHGLTEPEPEHLTPEIAAAFERGFEHAKLLPPKKRADVEAWLHQQQGTTPQQVVETTTPAEPAGGHWLRSVHIDSGRGHGKTSFIERLKVLLGK